MKSKSKKIGLMLLIMLVAISIVLITLLTGQNQEKDKSGGIKELSYGHRIAGSDSEIVAADSIPENVYCSAQDFIINNGYDGKNIIFSFKNSHSAYDEEYPTYGKEFVYYVEQLYNYITVGYFSINEEGDIVTIHNLKTFDELITIPMEPEIGFDRAYEIVKDYLDLNKITHILVANRQLYLDLVHNEFILVYRIWFENTDKVVYVDAITGEVVKVIAGAGYSKLESE